MDRNGQASPRLRSPSASCSRDARPFAPRSATPERALTAPLNRREVAIKVALDTVRARCDVAARRAADPVGFVHRFASVEDRELVALVAACIAFGNVKTIRSKLEDLLDRLGANPSRLAGNRKALAAR